MRWILAVAMLLALPAAARPSIAGAVDVSTVACDYEDVTTGEASRIPAVDLYCLFDVAHWAWGSTHDVRMRAINAAGEASAWTSMRFDRPQSATAVVTLVGNAPVAPPQPPPPQTAEVTVFGSSAPTLQDTGDTASVNLGLRFTTSVPGNVLGVRFYKQAGNGGTHIGALWSETGAAIAQATFSGETAAGWQEVRFATPASIAVGQTYIASYLAPQGRYPYTANAEWPRAAAPLSALGGVYAYGSALARPASSWQASHYWVDVIFKEN